MATVVAAATAVARTDGLQQVTCTLSIQRNTRGSSWRHSTALQTAREEPLVPATAIEKRQQRRQCNLMSCWKTASACHDVRLL